MRFAEDPCLVSVAPIYVQKEVGRRIRVVGIAYSKPGYVASGGVELVSRERYAVVGVVVYAKGSQPAVLKYFVQGIFQKVFRAFHRMQHSARLAFQPNAYIVNIQAEFFPVSAFGRPLQRQGHLESPRIPDIVAAGKIPLISQGRNSGFVLPVVCKNVENIQRVCVLRFSVWNARRDWITRCRQVVLPKLQVV